MVTPTPSSPGPFFFDLGETWSPLTGLQSTFFYEWFCTLILHSTRSGCKLVVADRQNGLLRRQVSRPYLSGPSFDDQSGHFCHIKSLSQWPKATPSSTMRSCIKSRADALANLPDPARWFPAREMRPSGNYWVHSRKASALLGNIRRRVFCVSLNCKAMSL